MKTGTDFWVGDRLVRPSLGEIERGLERVHVEPRSIEVLLVLVGRAPEVVSKKELIDAVWGEAFVSEGVITHAISDLRRALGDSATDPEFIQTIHKRGYRLIAPVGELTTDEEMPSSPAGAPGWRKILWALMVLTALIGVMIWVGGDRESRPAVDDGAPRIDPDPGPAIDPANVRLVLQPTRSGESYGEAARELDQQLLNQLAGGSGPPVRSADSCSAGSDAAETFCLEPSIQDRRDGHRVAATLQHAASAELVYSVTATSTDPSAAAEEIVDRVRTFFRVIGMKHWNDPDIEPWISNPKNDIRAIEEFLLGVEYVYLNRTGGRDPMAVAMELDPGFVAPRVWRTPTMVAEESEETLAAHRDELERLWRGATGFERAMIRWAQALIDRKPGKEITYLRAALLRQPSNRPTLFAFGVALMERGDLEGSWQRAFRPLLDQRWDYPGLHTQAAECALRRDSLDDFRLVLASAELDSADPAILALQQLLSIFDEDARDGERVSEALEQASRDPELDLAPFAGLLADKADAEGRKEIAARLREFAD